MGGKGSIPRKTVLSKGSPKITLRDGRRQGVGASAPAVDLDGGGRESGTFSGCDDCVTCDERSDTARLADPQCGEMTHELTPNRSILPTRRRRLCSRLVANSACRRQPPPASMPLIPVLGGEPSQTFKTDCLMRTGYRVLTAPRPFVAARLPTPTPCLNLTVAIRSKWQWSSC
jgi:hypothetical protein